MDKKAFFSYYSKILGGATFTETYRIYKSLDKETQRKLTQERTMKTKERLLAENPSYFKDQHKARVGYKMSEETKEKIRATLKKRHDSEKLSEAQRKRYAEQLKTDEIIEKQRQTLLKTYSEHPEIREKISASVKKLHAEREAHSKKHPAIIVEAEPQDQSEAKRELQEFVKSLDSNAVFNDRETLHNGLELDVYCPDKKVAVEYDGDIWHSEAYKENAETCQLDKTFACEALGIRLIHIFSDEWNNKRDICKSIVASSLGVYKRKYMARKLRFAKVPKQAGIEFFKANHIQGNAPAPSYYGLYDKMKLVQCISVGANRFRRDGSLELIRMATLRDCEVVGGFSKLLKHALEDIGVSVIGSYVDRRLFNGKGYASSGWKLIGYSGQSYFYTDGTRRWNRLSFTKQACLKKWPECTPDMTEHQMCLDHGLYRLFDCGTIKVEYHLP